jgi:methylmalonyl-CoA epimerase
MGAKVSAPKAQPAHGVTVVFVELPNTKIELLHPLGEKSPIANFLARNADGGIHHVCYEVEDIYAARDKLKAGAPRAGRRRAQDRRPRQAGAVPASQGLHRHADRARAGLGASP